MGNDASEPMVEKDEGFGQFCYDDATGKLVVPGYTLVGHPTVGYGRALDTHGITREEAEYLLGNDLEVTEIALTQEYPWFQGLNEARRAAVTDMAVNVGMAGFALFKNMIAALAAGDFDGAAKEVESSLWARQLPSRSEEVAEALRSGILGE